MQGCGDGVLELRCIFSLNPITNLVKRAEEKVNSCPVLDTSGIPALKCECLNSLGVGEQSSYKVRKAAAREDSSDNNLYCPRAADIRYKELRHFQQHWIRGEPVIVSDVLDTGSGLSWEPLVMWRACRQKQHSKHDKLVEVAAIDCLD